MSRLFTYGTLQNEEVLKALLGKELSMERAQLKGYKISGLIDRYYPAIVPSAGDYVEGFLIHEIDDSDLQIITEWEGNEYTPTTVAVSDLPAICFVWTASPDLIFGHWDNEVFRQKDMQHIVEVKIPAFLFTLQNPLN